SALTSLDAWQVADPSLGHDRRPVDDGGSSVRMVNTRRSTQKFTRGAARRDLDNFDSRIGQHRVERGRELSRLAPDDEPIPPGVLAEVRHHEVASLLRCPGRDSKAVDPSSRPRTTWSNSV